jgi:hypothetical protein
VSEREDVFWELHTIVAGVKSASDTSRCYIDREEVPPLNSLGGAEEVWESGRAVMV